MKRRLSMAVIFDSNITFGLPISKEVRDFIESMDSDKRVNTSYYVPETVLEEAKKKFLDDYKKSEQEYLGSTKTLSIILRTKKFPKVSAAEATLEKKVEKIFRSCGIETLQTPNDKINWSDLRKSAVFQKPPFSQGNTEKGFKDAIIAQTILISLPNFGSKRVAIICKDGLLSDFLREKTKRRKNVTVYPSLPDFQSALRLLLLGDRLIDEITNEAKLAFYNPQDAFLQANQRRSIFYREDFPRQILTKFPSLFANPKVRPDPYYGLTTWHSEVQVNWAPVEEPTFSVTNPVFIGKSANGDYIWQSTVVYRQIFEHSTPPGGLYSGFSSRGEQRLEFQVKWASPVDKHGKIDPTKCTIKDITPNIRDESMGAIPPMPQIYAATEPPPRSRTVPSWMTSGPTQAGQGTVPILPLSGPAELEPTLKLDISQIGSKNDDKD